MVYKYCYSCYALNSGEDEICQYCGQSLKARQGEDYIDKLIWALNHRDKEVVSRAVTILGMLGPEAYRALPALEKAFKAHKDDPYLQSEIVLAIGRIGGPRAKSFLLDIKRHPGSVMVERALAQVLRELDAT